ASALAALRSQVRPLAVVAEERAAGTADRRVVRDRRPVEHARPARRYELCRRIRDRTRHAEPPPAAVLAAILRPFLAARRARRVRDAGVLAAPRRLRGGLLAHRVPGVLPLTVVAPELPARLARRRAVREHRPLVEAGVVSRGGGSYGAGGRDERPR